MSQIESRSAGRARGDYALNAGLAVGSPKPTGLGTINLSQKQWNEVLEKIRRSSAANPESIIERRHKRHEGMGLQQVVVEIAQPGGTSVPLLARAHNISASGIGFLHGRYIYPHSTCVCWMRHAAQGLTPLHGTVRWCKLITGTVHMAGVQLDEPLDVNAYLPCPDA